MQKIIHFKKKDTEKSKFLGVVPGTFKSKGVLDHYPPPHRRRPCGKAYQIVYHHT